MPIEYNVFLYDYQTESQPLPKWLEAKDDEGWELVTTLPRNYCHGVISNHILRFVFRRKV